MWREAIVGAGIIIASNALLYPLAQRMDHARSKTGREHEPADYLLEVECTPDAEPGIRGLVNAALTQANFQLKSVRSMGTTIPNQIALQVELQAVVRNDAAMEGTVRELSVDSAVRSVRWTAMNEAGVQWGGR